MRGIAVIGPDGAVGTSLDRLQEGADRLSREGKYRLAPEVEEIARRLIPEHHKHLATARIAYVMAESLPAQKGKAPMAKAQKASDAQNLLHGYDFVITVNRQVWVLLTSEQREALVDHELSHCGLKEDGSGWTIWAHDVEEFAAVIQRHGLWAADLKVFAKAAAEQLEFDLKGATQ